MKNPFDNIEARLQFLIESSALLFTGDAPRPLLAHMLVEAMRSHMRQDGAGGFVAPGLYQIHVNPITMQIWQEAESKLTSFLQESARDAGITFTSTPVVRIIVNSNLAEQEIRIETSDTPPESGFTAIITPLGNKQIDKNTAPARINAYLIVNGGDLFVLNQPVVNIGRRHDNHLVVDDQRVSRNHCQLRLVHHSYVLFDLNSTGGTFVNNIRISRQSLKGGDVISLAGAQLIYGEDSATPGQSTDGLLDDDTANIKRDGMTP
jgi:pSer/pThr/pTyr-binding forkhead associated (FHA) protein